MARITRAHNGMKKKGEAGAAKNYITRNQAIKKLQCTLSDFRRLCILKGIYPREPKSRKKANKGSTIPASFYYAKDIQYLLHEPVLGKLREHKAFAKKLSRAIGRGEWHLAKNLEESKPVYRLDHIIKERCDTRQAYPTFTDSLRDLDDALCLIVLFASLPATTTIPAAIISNCTQLAAQWQLYVMRTRSLRKVFLSIKGIYFQAEVQGQTVTWLVPYMFTQTVSYLGFAPKGTLWEGWWLRFDLLFSQIPSDLDYRIMLTFLELYQTLLGFVFYKLYTDINLIYPPKLDQVLDEHGAGIGALLLEENGQGLVVVRDDAAQAPESIGTERRKPNAKDVRKQIKQIGLGGNEAQPALEDDEQRASAAASNDASAAQELDVFPSNGAGDEALQPEATSAATSLFEGYFFYLSREVTRPTLEFVIRSLGGQVGWDAVLGAGSPFEENDVRITHHVVDRPVVAGAPPRSHPGKRAYIQPQWVVDCINRRTLLPTDQYAPGQVLPPHLSPFVDEDEVRERDGYVPMEARRIGGINTVDADMDAEQEEEEDEDEDDAEEGEGEDEEMDEDEGADEVATKGKKGKKPAPALLAAAKDPKNAALLHAAELEAESRGVEPAQFEAELASETKKAKKDAAGAGGKVIKAPKKVLRSQEEQLASIMLTGKQKKLYSKMVYSKDRRAEETAKLVARKRELEKKQQKRGIKGSQVGL
ncbi:BQ2448_1799 [Microbotryum intermedium]|uniref:Pescadillo homolog n=1 Tax=Microbotryum intermedium TaxID=269621 RepID=A0A238FB22_9BASI|nr:BQ2448_1799 [Microbotryum intermedium]